MKKQNSGRLLKKRKAVLILFLIISLFLPGLSFGTATSATPPSTLRIVHNINNPPLKFADGVGHSAGLLNDLWRLWGEKTGHTMEFIALPWEKSIQMVRDGEADIHAGLFFTEKRDDLLDFSNPILNVEYQVFVHSSILDVNSLSDLAGFRVGVPEGYTRDYMEEQVPGIALAVYKDFPSLYEAAMRNEVRIFISPQFNYSDYLSRQTQEEHYQYSFSPVFPAYSRNYRGAVAEGRKELLAEINQGLAAITPVKRAVIEHKWLLPGKSPLDVNSIRISIPANHYPLTFLDGDGKPGGFLVDLWRLWAEKTGRRVVFLPGSWKESVNAVANAKADIHSGLPKTEGRSEWMLFSEPVYGLSSRFYFSNDIPAVQTISDVGKRQVGVVQGTWQLDYLQKHFPASQLSVFDTTGDMVNALQHRQVELVFAEDLNMDTILERQRLRGRVVSSQRSLLLEPVLVGVSKNNKNLMAEIRVGFSRISRAERLAIERRWVKDPARRFYSPLGSGVQPDLSDSEKAWLAAHPQIRVGGMVDWAPIGFVSKEGVQQGLTADFLRLIEKRLNSVFLFDSTRPWPEKLDQIRNQKIDMIANIVKTEERSQFLLFSVPYFTCPYAIVTRRMDGQTIGGIQDLADKTLAVEKDYYLSLELKKKHPEIHLMVEDSTLQALEAVASEKADAYIGNRAVIAWLIEKEQLQDLKISGNTNFAPTLLRFGVRKDWPEFVSILNKTLDTISFEEHRAIRAKWLGVDGKNSREVYQHIRITAAEQAWLDTLSQVRLGVASHMEPLEYIDDNGGYSGISSDFMRRFFQQLGITIAPVKKTNWPGVLNKVQAKELDIVPMVVPTPERSEYLNFTKPYLDFPLAVFTRRDSSLITGLDDLSGKRIAVERGEVTSDSLRQNYPDLEVVEVSTVLDGLEAVSYGQAHAFVGNLVLGSYLIDHEGLRNVKIAAPTPYKSSLSIGVRKDWPLLIPLLNKTIDDLTREEKANIRSNWLKVRYDRKVDYRVIWKILAVFTLIVMLVLWRNLELKRRKAQLEASEKQFKLLINAMPIAIIVVDYNGNIVFDNAQAGREMGGNKSIVGRTSQEFYARADDRSRILAIIADKGKVVGEQVEYQVDSGGTIDCLLSVIPIRFDGQDVLLAVTVNVTERVVTQRALEKAMRQAKESDQLKSAFLASMSHELRTPLNSIIGFTGIMIQQLTGPLNDEQSKQLSMVQGSANHLLALINDVLDISKIEAGELVVVFEEFEFHESIEKVVQTVQPLADRQGLLLSIDISPEVGRINSDHRRVEQVLLNLLGNAVKFTDSGGVSVRCRVENNLLVTDVTDTGSGIKPEDMDKLFQTFKQIDTGLDRIHEGTGLGLSISKKLVEKLGGDIQVHSKWGIGSTFTFRLPIIRKETVK